MRLAKARVFSTVPDTIEGAILPIDAIVEEEKSISATVFLNVELDSYANQYGEASNIFLGVKGFAVDFTCIVALNLMINLWWREGSDLHQAVCASAVTLRNLVGC